MGCCASDRFKQDSNAIEKAANAISECDALLIATGAGFSADSGLATYPGVADIKPYREQNLTYHDLCQPIWMTTDPAIHFGFWGDCTDVYRETAPHEGYGIVRRWCDELVSRNTRLDEDLKTAILNYKDAPYKRCHRSYIQKRTPDQCTVKPFFSLTSNVDAHFWNPKVGAKFLPSEVSEIHGDVEYWQCANSKCDQLRWKLPSDYGFNVDKNTMRAAEESWLKCPTCGSLARPNILMFNDNTYENPDDQWKWRRWRDSILKLRDHRDADGLTTNIVVLEMGAGCRVPSIRNMSEYFSKTAHTTHIRINPDVNCLAMHGFKTEDGLMSKDVTYIPIKSTCLKALKQMDAIISS